MDHIRGRIEMIKVRMLKAAEGDFIWVSYGSIEEHHILIDGGVRECGDKYAQIIKDISDKDEIIEAIILTHIDYDHIAGACAGIARVKSEILQKVVKRIIFNVSEKMQKDILVEKVTGSYSVKEGMEFFKLLEEKGIKDRLKSRTIAGENIELAEEAILKVISPGERQLEELYNKWEKYEKKNETVGYASNLECVKEDLVDLMKIQPGTDRSINNASSIAFIFEYKDYRGAFLADAKPSVCLQGMNRIGIKEPYEVDFIKLAHHGSLTNTSLKLLQMLPTENYLLSTNGNHKKVPSKVIIAKLVQNCEKINKLKVRLYCNYDWQETVYHNNYFTKNDQYKYLNTRKLQLYILKKEEIDVRDGLKLYGRWQNSK